MMSLTLDTFWEPNGSQFWFLYLFLFVVEQTFKILTGRFHPLSRIGDLLNTAPLRNEATPCGPIHHQAPPRCLLFQQHRRLLVSLGLLQILLCYAGVKFTWKKRLSDPSCFSNSVDVLFSSILFRNLPFHFKLTYVNTIVIIREGDYPKYDMMGRGRGGLDSGYSLKMMMSFMNSP